MIRLTELVGYPNLEWHILHGRKLSENIYRYSSDSFLKLFEEARIALNEGKIKLSPEDEELIQETDIGLYGEYNGVKVPLDLPMEYVTLDEAEYKGKKVSLNKPKRSSGPKKYYVYTKNPKTGKVVKVNFGAEGGGQNLAVKLDDPKRRKAFADRHQCSTKKDKTKPSYWSCRLPRFTRILGMSLAPSNTFW